MTIDNLDRSDGARSGIVGQCPMCPGELVIQRFRSEGRMVLYAHCTLCDYERVQDEWHDHAPHDVFAGRVLFTVALLAVLVTLLWLLTGRP